MAVVNHDVSHGLVHAPRRRPFGSVRNGGITKLGGIRNTMTALRICETAGLTCRFGAAFGPSLLQAMGAQVASCARELPFASEFSEHDHLLDDPCEALIVENGEIRLPAGSGCGLSLLDNAATT